MVKKKIPVNIKNTQKITIKLTTHPNEWKYCGRINMEYKISQLKYLSTLDDEQSKMYLDAELICNKSLVKEFLDSLIVNDEIGFGTMLYKVKEISKDGFVVIIPPNTKEISIGLKDIDTNIGFGFAEILKRNGELYNTKNSKEVILKIIKENPKNDKSKSKSIHKRAS